MLSKVKIDLNERNEPVIIIEWQPSDDLRDKVVKQFIEGFGYESNAALMKIEETRDNYRRLSISPVMDEPYIVTAQDLENNPCLKDMGVAVGDKYGSPADISLNKRTS